VFEAMKKASFYIFGYYGSKNAGDEAFKLAFQELLPKGAELRFIRPSELAGNLDLVKQIHRQVMAGNAHLIVGGGAIIGEPYFWEHIPPGTPFHIISADIGSKEFLMSRYTATLEYAKTCWIRSEADAELLADLGAGGPFQFLPDIVHSLAPASRDVNAIGAMEPQARNLKLLECMAGCCENTMASSQLRNKNVAIFLSDHYYDYKTIGAVNVLEGIEREAADKMYLRQLRMAIDELLQYYNIYFFSLSFWYNSIDSFVGYQLARFSRHAPLYNLVNRYLEPAEILALMPYFDLAISMKFHGLIFPMAAGVPVMNLGTSKKNQDLAKQMGLVSVLPEALTVPGFLQALKQVESLEYTTSVAETQRRARESILTAFAPPRRWD
jgi:hypothetical protein